MGFAAEPCASTAEPLLPAETGAAAEATADSSAAAELRTHLRERKPLDLARKLVRPWPPHGTIRDWLQRGAAAHNTLQHTLHEPQPACTRKLTDGRSTAA